MTISSCLTHTIRLSKIIRMPGRFFILTEVFSTRAEYFRKGFENKAWNSLCPVLDTALIMVLVGDYQIRDVLYVQDNRRDIFTFGNRQIYKVLCRRKTAGKIPLQNATESTKRSIISGNPDTISDC